MKRHSSLIPLSREHHQQLLLARLMRNDAPVYKGLPSDKKGKLEYAKVQLAQHLLDHWKKEEELFNKVVDLADQELSEQLRSQKLYREKLRESFAHINLHNLDAVGRLLENAVRYEERVLFQAIQTKIQLDQLEFNF